jgi:hypothetical protein
MRARVVYRGMASVLHLRQTDNELDCTITVVTMRVRYE